MVNVRGLVRLATVAVALCAASSSARDAPSTAGVRSLQLADDTTTPESPSPVTVGPAEPSSTSPAPVVTEPVSPSPVTPTPTTTEPATTTPAPTSTQPATTTPAPTSTQPATTTPAPTSTQPATTTPAPTSTTPEPVTTTPAPEPVTTTPAPPPTDPVTTTPTPPPTDPVTTTPAPPPTDPVTTTPAPPPTDPVTTTPAPPPTDPVTTTPAPPPTDPVTTTPAPPPTDPVTTTPAPPPTDPVTTTPAPPPTDPVTTTPAPPPTDPVTTTPAPPPTDPVTTTPAPPPTDPVTTTPAPPPTDPVTTTPAPPPTDPVTTTPAPPPTDPVTTTPAPPPTDPVTTTPAPPPTDPVTTTPAPPPTDPVTTTPAPPPTDPVTTTPAPPPTDPVTTTPAPPPTDPVTTTPAPPPTDPVTTTPTPTDPTSSAPPPTTAPPPLVDVIVATERVETPSPSTTRSADPTSEPEVNSQANKKDIITANSTDETDAPKVNPFEIRVIESESPKPVVLDINDERTKTEEPKLYVRGDTTTQPPSSAGSAGSSKNDAPASSPNVIGGSRRNTGATTGSVLSKSSQNFHDFLRYAAAAFSGISVALLLFFHFVSLDATLTWTSSLWSPNTWEFILYVGYLQQMASVSQLTLLKTPYYLWDYADSFAWTNFLIQRPTSSEGRRLETIVLGGVVAYADRIGIDESKIVYHAVIGFAVVLAVLLVLFLIIAMFAKRKAEQALDDPLNLHHSTQSVHALRSASIRTLGLCVLIWYFSLYPLSLYASFEISMEVQAKSAVASALLVSILAIGVVCFGVLAWSGRVIMQKSKEELLQFENMATWGSLYAEFSFRSRMFFILGALVQIVTGIIVGTMDSDPTQLIIVIIIEVLYLVAVFVLSPFAEMLVLRFTYALGILKIINYSLAFAFLNSNGMSGTGRNSVANAFIGINTIVIIAWFIRQLIVFSTYIRAWSVRTSFIEETQNAQEDGTAKYETRTATDSDVYASVSTARHGEGGPSVDTDDYHQAPAPREIHY